MEIEKRKSICDIFYSRTDGLGQWISYEGSYKAEISDDIFFFLLEGSWCHLLRWGSNKWEKYQDFFEREAGNALYQVWLKLADFQNAFVIKPKILVALPISLSVEPTSHIPYEISRRVAFDDSVFYLLHGLFQH